MPALKELFIGATLLSLAGCSNNPIEVVGSSWDCAKRDAHRECLVSFSIKNNDDFVQQSTVKIRAHRRRRNGDAVSNEVVAENTIIATLTPKEQKSIQYEMIIEHPFTQIVVSAYIAK